MFTLIILINLFTDLKKHYSLSPILIINDNIFVFVVKCSKAAALKYDSIYETFNILKKHFSDDIQAVLNESSNEKKQEFLFHSKNCSKYILNMAIKTLDFWIRIIQKYLC